MLVEAAFAASRAPGPLRAFFRRVKDRRGFQIATVAVACKLTVLSWHLVIRGEVTGPTPAGDLQLLAMRS